jgi:ATP-dependent Clp protease ATP-binding subunit ClpB
LLTEAITKKPHAVLLLDEIEKAHNDVFNVLLQVLDDGRMTDGQGRTVDFKNTVIVMTSNLGSHMIQSMEGSDPAMIKVAVMDEVRQHFRPEFINRVDEIVVFHALDEKNIGAIAKVQLRILEQRLEKMEMKLEISEKALQRIAEAGFDPLYGARPLKRAIQQQLENPLSKQILEGRFGPKDVIAVDVKDDRLVFEKAGG